MKKLRRVGIILRNILLGVIGIVLAIVLTMTIIPMTETNEVGANTYDTSDSVNWMAAIDGSRKLNEINIPGTHDSASNHVQLGFFSKCQDTTIYEQLQDGFRYLDVRLAMAADGSSMRLMHGFCECTEGVMPWSGTLMLDSVLEQCYRFLAEHPSETIIFVVKLEYGEKDFVTFQKALNAYIQKNRDSWLLTDTMPTLEEARGKLVLLRRYSDYAGLGTEAGIDFYWSDQRGSDLPENFYAIETKADFLMTVQDRFELTAENKWMVFRNTIDRSPMDEAVVDEQVVHLNFLTTKGPNSYGHPYTYAKTLNRTFLEEKYTPTDKLGWVILDFGNASLAKHVYQNN